jgi:hypothetical protein
MSNQTDLVKEMRTKYEPRVKKAKCVVDLKEKVDE